MSKKSKMLGSDLPQANVFTCKDGFLYRGFMTRTGFKCGYCRRGIVGDVYVQWDCKVCHAKKVRG